MPFKCQLTSSEAIFGNGLFDSEVTWPNGVDRSENAALTLTIRLTLDFADQYNRCSNIVTKDGKTYAKDFDGWLFPILDWNKEVKQAYLEEFKRRAEAVWSGRFWLKTPAGYDPEYNMAHIFPGDANTFVLNVKCLMRIKYVTSDKIPHRQINLFNIDTSATTVYHESSSSRSRTVDATKSYFRSDDTHYDSLDFLRPKTGKKVALTGLADYLDKLAKGAFSEVRKDTIGHEIGHALGQAHIAFLLDPKKTQCQFNAPTNSAAECYKGDDTNIMAGGDRLALVNAISWQERMAEHYGSGKGSDWLASMTPLAPRKMAAKKTLGLW